MSFLLQRRVLPCLDFACTHNLGKSAWRYTGDNCILTSSNLYNGVLLCPCLVLYVYEYNELVLLARHNYIKNNYLGRKVGGH